MLAFALLNMWAAAGIDDTWRAWLESPPPAAVALAANLTSRAAALAASVGTPNVTGDLDVVCSGGGNLDGYYMGAYQVLARIGGLRMLRFAGASAGGEMPFEVALKGEVRTLQTHLAYGLLEEANPEHFANELVAGELQDHHWRIMAAWQAAKWNASLAALDGRVLLATSCLDPWPKLVMASNFSSVDRATRAFMATGTVAEIYDGMLCSDGGATSGPRMTPLFHDAPGGRRSRRLAVHVQSEAVPA